MNESPKGKREKKIDLAAKILRSIVDCEVVVNPDGMEPAIVDGFIVVSGANITVKDTNAFATALSLAKRYEIIPRFGGKVDITLLFEREED